MVYPFFLKIGVLSLCCLMSVEFALFAQDTLKITLMFSSGKQRKIFNQKIVQFKKENPRLKVQNKEEIQEKYKNRIEGWLQGSQPHSDVFLWFAGVQLNAFVKKGWIEPLDELWKKKWNQEFTISSKEAVTFHKKVTVYLYPITSGGFTITRRFSKNMD